MVAWRLRGQWNVVEHAALQDAMAGWERSHRYTRRTYHEIVCHFGFDYVSVHLLEWRKVLGFIRFAAWLEAISLVVLDPSWAGIQAKPYCRHDMRSPICKQTSNEVLAS